MRVYGLYPWHTDHLTPGEWQEVLAELREVDMRGA